MDITEERHGDVVVLAVTGKVGGEQPLIADSVEKLLCSGEQRILLDLRHVKWIDSQGVGDLLRSKMLADKAGARVATVYVPRSQLLDGPATALESLNNRRTLNEALEFLRD